MPGVLLIEAMAQTSGWLVVAANRFERMPFLAAVKDAKFRMFVTPGQKFAVKATLVHEGSGYAITKASIALDGKPICDAVLTLRGHRFPERRNAAQDARNRRSGRVPGRGAGQWLSGTREVWITGIGIVSCLGEGPDAHWQKLMAAQPSADATTFAPFVVHPLAPINFDAQIPKKGDQRQMETWQRIGTYAAGLALDSAGVKGNTDILSRMDMIVAAGGGERDLTVDSTILTGITRAAESGRLPQRTADERSAADFVPGAAFQSARRQHLDRSRRHRLVAHLHGRRIRRRRCGAHRALAHRRRTKRHCAGRRHPITASAPIC